MKIRSLFFILLIVALLPWIANAQSGAAKGKGRLRGVITDENGKPLEGVTILFTSDRLKTSFELKSDAKGEWTAAGIAGGNWNLDFTKEGYETRQISYIVQQISYNKPVELSLKTAVVQQPTASAKQQDPAKLLIAEGSNLADQKDYAGAIAKYEEAMKLKPELHVLHGEIANTYVLMNQPDKALEHYNQLLAKDPSNQDAILAASSIYFEKKDLAGAKKVLEQLDLTTVTNPNTLYNVGVQFYNAQQTEDSEAP